MESDLVIWPGGIVGFRVVREQGAVSHVNGVALAFRKNGDEVLFARSDEDSRDPATWIGIGDFVVHPAVLATEEDLYEDEPLAEGIDIEPSEQSPLDPKRTMRVLRRREPNG